VKAAIPAYLVRRRDDQHDVRLGSPLGYHNRRIRALVRRMIEDSGINVGTALDFGCGQSPYRGRLPEGTSYIGADLAGNEGADVTLRADGSLPVDDARVDLVLSTQVLEHVEDPALYLSESLRVLRPGGKLVLSTHGIMYYHRDPVDHWRWTRTGLTKIVEAAGFEVVKLYGMMGLAAAALQLFQDGTQGRVPRYLRPLYVLVMQGAIAFMDRFYSDESRVDNGLVLAVLASKPVDPRR
jgi:SAM-dependent methyltransferase